MNHRGFSTESAVDETCRMLSARVSVAWRPQRFFLVWSFERSIGPAPGARGRLRGMSVSVRAVVVAVILAVAAPVGAAPRLAAEPPLVVLVVIDGLRAADLERAAAWPGSAGLRRLVDGGTLFERAEYPYATTKTCPGHATISTGTLPARHGIVGNEWFDRETRAVVSCVADAGSPTLGASPGAGVSGRWLRAPALADAVVAGGGNAVAVSLKDRAAAMLAGQRGVAFWWGPDGFTTSRGYAAALPPFVVAWNRARPRLAGTTWERAAERSRYVGVDDDPRERPPAGLGRSFPHPVSDDGAVYTPAGADWVIDLALAAVAGAELGAGDLLAISVSTVDVVGHAFGPDSHEAVDALVRLDRGLARLLDGLDRTVGRDRYVVALTADHGMGAAPPAERRVAGDVIVRAAEVALDEALGAADWVEAFREPHLYLRPEALARGAKPAAIAARAIARVPGVAAAFTARELAGGGLAARVRRSAAAPRSGDVIVVAAPGFLIAPDDDIAASHGTPHAHDRHVPLIVMGPGIAAQRIARPVSPVDLAPTLARFLGVALPGADGAPLREVLPRRGR
jgi:hypothetical protein